MRNLKLILVSVGVLAVVLVGWAIVLWDTWRATYLVVVKRLNPRDFAAHQAPPPTDPQMVRRIVSVSRLPSIDASKFFSRSRLLRSSSS